ncbi:lipopolysaccharide biosynthesis protein [[Clostridium] scindens]|uniref:lipopolysaccharide biosynthesis protein n=1 Tax=Clostridium scindens (strain JCM 10418 / VPI 12708) TaxID=29347 RepID=UPI001AA0CDD7|nr:hypothetical protein [[Clostridium] scindens]MBO1683296.1 hypothetical protein [[Clostridium] scindens]
MTNKLWLVKKEDIEKQSFFWNIMSSVLNSVVSVLLLWFVTRINGVSDAGLFSLGFSTSQMMLTLGNYGMRNYQATDIKNKYSMSVYIASRVITNLVMMISAFGFIFIEGYNIEKAAITLLLCLLRVTDAFDDVYGGYYQKLGRLDISGKIMSLRIMSYVVAFCLTLYFSNNLIWSCIIAIIVSGIILGDLVNSTKEIVPLEKAYYDIKKIGYLLKECFPLCISAFLLIYMGNAPKYAIDFYLSSNEQAYYTYLFMPCFVTNLFVGFALQPLLVRLSKAWIYNDYRKFIKLCGLISVSALLMAVIVVIVGGAVGCQILSIVFGVDLNGFKEVLIILLIGGAFFAFSVIEQVILTVMRKQTYLLICFLIASFTAFLTSNPLVHKWGLLGAGYAYVICAGVLFGVLAIMILVFIIVETKKLKTNRKQV